MLMSIAKISFWDFTCEKIFFSTTLAKKSEILSRSSEDNFLSFDTILTP